MTPATTAAPRLLVVGASPRGEASYSLTLAEAFVAAYTAARPDAEVDRLDVFADLPAFGAAQTAAKMAVISGQPVPEDAAAEWEGVKATFDRVAAADLLVFATPIWNHGLPWALKLFIDTVTQPGLAFGFDPAAGYHGLLGGRRAVALLTSAVYSPGVGPEFGIDDAEPALRYWLRFVGIDALEEVRLQPTYPTPDFDERLDRALAQADELGRRLAAESGSLAVAA